MTGFPGLLSEASAPLRRVFADFTVFVDLEDFPAFTGFEEAATTFFFIFLAAEALALIGFVAFGMALCSPRSYELDPCSP
jgi:hypothetical protein